MGLLDAYISATYSPLLRQYALSSVSDSLLVSMMVASLASLDQLSGVFLFPGMGCPCSRALLRQLYRVCNPMPSLLATSATLLFIGGDSLLNMVCFLS